MNFNTKLFGAFLLAVKLPSVILSSLMVPALYDLTRRLTDRNTAWLAAFLLTFISAPAQLVTGYKNTDHNDVIFSAMLLFSVWTWVRYTESRKVHWVMFTGLFSGAAVLTKWATGLFVFLIWGISNLLSAERKDQKIWKSLIAGTLVCAAIVLPWYVYIFRAFPVEAEYEFSYNALHFTMAIEGHEGNWYYHFTALTDLLGWPALFLSVAGWFFLLKKRETSTRTLPLLLSVIFFIVFYSVAQTKMPLFLLPLVPFILIGTGHAIIILFRFASALTERKLMAGSAGILLALLLMDLPSVVSRFDPSTPLCWLRGIREHDRKISEDMSKQLPGDKWVIFNFPDNHRAAHMFYTDQVVYRELPSCDSLLLFKRRGYNVAVMKGANTSDSTFRCPEIPLLENSFDEK